MVLNNIIDYLVEMSLWKPPLPNNMLLKFIELLTHSKRVTDTLLPLCRSSNSTRYPSLILCIFQSYGWTPSPFKMEYQGNFFQGKSWWGIIYIGKHFKLVVLTYCEVHNEPDPSNTMTPITHEDIFLDPTVNLNRKPPLVSCWVPISATGGRHPRTCCRRRDQNNWPWQYCRCCWY